MNGWRILQIINTLSATHKCEPLMTTISRNVSKRSFTFGGPILKRFFPGRKEEVDMKRKKKKFSRGVPTHIYQKGFDRRVLFFCAKDRLVYLSFFFSEAKSRGIQVLSIVLMFNHVHATIICQSERQMIAFNQEVERRYASAFNRASGKTGPVFMNAFGWAQKRSDADVQSNLCYLANNPVKKKLCRRGIDNQWTLLAYGKERYPFSDPLALRKASRKMRRAVALAKDSMKRGQVLSYPLLDRIFADLDQRESRQMVDYLIQNLSNVDYEAAARYFGDYDKMIAAFDVTTGAEYDISEEFVPESDRPYEEMIKVVEQEGYDLVKKAFLSAEGEEKMRLIKLFRRRTSASERQIRRFLHLPFNPASKKLGYEYYSGARYSEFPGPEIPI